MLENRVTHVAIKLIILLVFVPFTQAKKSNVPAANAASVDSSKSFNFQLKNEIIFALAGESLTSRDETLFKEISRAVLPESKLSRFTQNQFEDFVLSRIAVREADLFDLKGDLKPIPEELKSKLLTNYSLGEIQSETQKIMKAYAYIEMREKMLKNSKRFSDWLLVMRRKYLFNKKGSS